MKTTQIPTLVSRGLLLTATAMSSAIGVHGAALAQTAPSAQVDGGQAPSAEEFVVTARKRSESVQTIPDSIRPISAEELERLGADSLSDYVGVTPGLQLTGSRAATQVVIRGVTTGPVNHDQTEIKETVGLYLDETSIAVQRYNPNLKLFDLDHIEVLRGPQGTLYGAGSMAGAIRMITRKPQADHFEAEAEASTGHVSHGGEDYALDGMVNIPVVKDVLAIRAVGSYRFDAGYIDNTFLNIPQLQLRRELVGTAGGALHPDAQLHARRHALRPEDRLPGAVAVRG